MNTDEIIRMAQQADCRRINDYYTNGTEHSFDDAALQRFVSLVAAAEREACAKVCDDSLFRIVRKPHCFDMAGPKECAEFIRARGNE